MTRLYDYQVAAIDGTAVDLSDYRGKVLLIVNVASQCGFTPQYKGLQALYDKYRERGFVVLGFPCNQFRQQEPGDGPQISTFCETHYGVSFPLFSKIDVNGRDAEPLFDYLKAAAPGLLGSKTIKWNFTKFLISRDGARIQRFAPSTTPEKLEPAIAALL
ncbi:MAG: glutathione peroxidase [Oceanospirillaceae bacterium]|nr:glutathione peroxidase [Oceanospirillaceae bacterium]